MKKSLRVLALLMLAVLLTGCAAQEQNFPDADTAQASAQQRDPMDLTTPVPRQELDLPEGYDPASEEIRFLECRLVNDYLGALGLQALHHALYR